MRTKYAKFRIHDFISSGSNGKRKSYVVVFIYRVPLAQGPKIGRSLVALDRWSLYTGLIIWKRYRDCTKLVFIDRWPLYTGGLSSRFDCTSLQQNVHSA